MHTATTEVVRQNFNSRYLFDLARLKHSNNLAV